MEFVHSLAGYGMYPKVFGADNRNRTDILGLEGLRTNRCAIPAYFNINILPESSLQNSNLRYCVTKAVSLSSRRKEQQWHAKGELTPRFELGLKPYQGLVLNR